MKITQTLVIMFAVFSLVACSSSPEKKETKIVKPASTARTAAKKTTQKTTEKTKIENLEIEAEEVTAADLEAVGVRERRIRELRDVQKEAILRAYEESPEEFYIVEEEVQEEPGQNIVNYIENSNYKIEVASVGESKESGKLVLSAESTARLARLAALLNSHPDAWTDLSVRGFADKYTDFNKNVELAHHRAFLAFATLRNNGVNQNKMSIQAYGAKKARAEGDLSTWIKNHRVLIIVNNVNIQSLLAIQLKKIESEPINIAGPPPKVIVKQEKARIFKISVEGIGSGFKTAKDVLNQEARERLQRLAILLDLHQGEWRHVAIHGHADIRGSSGYNLDLSNRRAFSVLRVLRSEGVPAGRLSTTAFGEAKPLVNKNSAYAWQKNRRVEIMVSGVHKGTSLEKALKRLILPKKIAKNN